MSIWRSPATLPLCCCWKGGEQQVCGCIRTSGQGLSPGLRIASSASGVRGGRRCAVLERGGAPALQAYILPVSAHSLISPSSHDTSSRPPDRPPLPGEASWHFLPLETLSADRTHSRAWSGGGLDFPGWLSPRVPANYIPNVVITTLDLRVIHLIFRIYDSFKL